MSDYFKTPKGTELPFLKLQGKQYLQVMHRLVWFREQNPEWTITTEPVQIDERIAVFSCTIMDKEGRVISKAHGSQLAKSFAAHIEKAESKAVGRALGFSGYGTSHAQELDDEDTNDLSQLADSPVPNKITHKITEPSTEAQQRMLYAVAKKSGLTQGEMEGILLNYGYKSFKDVKWDKVNLIKDEFESFNKGVK